MSERKGRALVRVADRPEEMTFHHPLNPNSEMRGVSLSEAAGLSRVGFHLVTIPPGKESNIYHSHHEEEEFYFILSGKGVVEIEGEEHQVGSGDFMGFPTSVAHLLRNPFEEDLVYLIGGERKGMEFAEFPKLGTHVLRVGRTAYTVKTDRLEPFWKQEE